MKSKAAAFIRRHGMIPPGAKVLCAVSGGADSIAMLHLLLELGYDVECAHFNHMIRGAESDRDEEFVRARCAALGVPFTAGRGDVPAFARERGMGTEEAARVMRYGFLEETALARSCERIATAHNAADNAETVILNLIRGTGLRGMCGIAPVRGNIIRPMLCLDRPEIEGWLREKGISFVTDSTNLTEDYARNRVRARVIAPLRELAPGFAEKTLAACESMRADSELIESMVPQCPDGQIASEELLALPEPVAARLIMRLAPGAGRAHVEAVMALARPDKPHGRLDLPGCTVTKQFGTLRFGAQERAVPEDVRLVPGGTVRWGRYEVSLAEGAAAPQKGLLCFKTAAICGNITVGSRREGDRLRQRGRGVTKTLKKLFSEARIEPDERALVPVLRDGAGVVGVLGFGEDERAAAVCGERAFIVKFEKTGGGTL